MLLKIYQSNNNELKASINITFLKPYITIDKPINDILEFIESFDLIIKQLEYVNIPKDYRKDIIRDLNSLPEKHSLDDIVEILREYKKKYQDKDEENIYDETISKIRNLQNKLVPYTWYHYGVIDDNSYFLFAHQDNKFPFKAVLLPIKHLSEEIKESFQSLAKYGEFFSPKQVNKEDQSKLSFFMMLADNSPSDHQQLFSYNVSGYPQWISKCKFIYKPLYSLSQARNEYTLLKQQNDIELSIFLS